jgi:hypothetical protein
MTAAVETRYARAIVVAPAPKSEAAPKIGDAAAAEDKDGAATACETEEDARRAEADAEAAAHVRWGDAEQMRVAVTQRSATPRRAASWRETVRAASVAEALLLTPGATRVLARPFVAPGGTPRARVLGVGALYAALECGKMIFVCALSRSAAVQWKGYDAPLDRITAAAVHGDELLLCDAETRLIVRISEWAHTTFADVDAGAAAGTHVTFNRFFVAACHGRTLRVTRRARRDGADATIAETELYEHSCALTSVWLDACTSASSRLLLCGDARGRIVGFLLNAAAGADGATPVLGGAPFCFELQPADAAQAPVHAVVFGGSRIVAAAGDALWVYDREGGRPGDARIALGPTRVALEAPAVGVAMWGNAIVVHDDVNRVRLYDARTLECTADLLSERARADVALPTVGAPAQSVAAACDQCGVLLPNGTLVFIDVDA